MDIHEYLYLMPTSKPVNMTLQILMIDTLDNKQRTTAVVWEVGTKAL